MYQFTNGLSVAFRRVLACGSEVRAICMYEMPLWLAPCWHKACEVVEPSMPSGLQSQRHIN